MMFLHNAKRYLDAMRLLDCKSSSMSHSIKYVTDLLDLTLIR